MKHIAIIILAFIFLSQAAQANLLVSPTRITFEGKDRVKDIILINMSDKARSYRIEWEENSTDEIGNYSVIPDNEVSFASSSFLRYAPRQVMLQPGERQVIKLMLRRKANMKLAEYRSHLKLTALPIQKNSNENITTSEQQGIGFKIDVLTSYTLPVIVRTEPSEAKVEIDSVSIKVNKDNFAFFNVDLRKTGVSSLFGTINVYLIDENSNESLVGVLRGVNIFHENNRRLANIQWLDYKRPVIGSLRVEYVGDDEFTGKQLSTYQTKISPDDFN